MKPIRRVSALLAVCAGPSRSPSGAANSRCGTSPSFDQDRDPHCSDGNNDDSGQDNAVDFPADPQCTSADDSEVAGGFQAKAPVRFIGTVNSAGADGSIAKVR